MTIVDFIKMEFPYFDPEKENALASDVWLRKISEWEAIKSKGEDLVLAATLNLSDKEKKAVLVVSKALYFGNYSDFNHALWDVIHLLTGVQYDDITEKFVENLYQILDKKNE